MKQDNNKSGLVAHLLDTESSQHPLLPRVCNACYDLLTEAIANAGSHNKVAMHCPHTMVLVEVELLNGMPLGVISTGPITQDEANAKIND